MPKGKRQRTKRKGVKALFFCFFGGNISNPIKPPTLPFWHQKTKIKGLKMEIKIETMWLSAKDFETQNPITGTITKVTNEKNKWGKDDIVVILLCGIEERKKTLYRSDLVEICRLYGNNTDKWLGKQIRFEKNLDPVTQKTKITLRPL